YEIEEYIAPVNVLICSKCCSIGHFRRRCTEQDETCKSCGQSFKDLKMHHCSSIIKCKHCNGDHLSNSMKCPAVKTFRADLTKKLMNINNNVTSNSSSIAADIANNNKSQHIKNDFPRAAAPWAPSSNPMDLKLNTLISGLSQVNETLSKLCVTNQGFQQFMIEKNENDKRINNEIDDLKSINNKMDQDVMVLNEKVNDLDKLMKSNDGIFKQFLFPMLDDILKFIDTKNVGRGGKTVDPDLKSKIDRFRNQMSDAMDETGCIDLYDYRQMFCDFKMFQQSGENSNGGILILVRNGIMVKRVECKLPNVCVIDVELEEDLRIIGVYAPDSRSWSWEDLSPFVNDKSVVYGDFNVDLEQDGVIADNFLDWADSLFLSPFVPDDPTSLRSDRKIDYAFSNINGIDIQTHKMKTTSDHSPVISVLPMKCKKQVNGKSIHWKVYSLFTEYTFQFWEKCWCFENVDVSYNDYIQFLSLLTARCTVIFPLSKYRIAIPPYIRCSMSYVRALSFRQKRTKSLDLKREVCYLRKIIKNELKFFLSSQLSYALQLRHTRSPISVSFWSKAKRFIKPTSSSLNGFIVSSGAIVNDSIGMCDIAADFYEDFFRRSDNIVRPHPYVDAPLLDFDNKDDPIPEVSLDELLQEVDSLKKKKSLDAHGLSNYMFNFLHSSHWSFLLHLYNLSFSSAILPVAWKDTRILLLAKKDSICSPALTRPISLLDCFQKVGEKLFLSRFRDVLYRRGLLPNNQSGFREGFSSPTVTLFVDFKSAFDMLWHEGCVGKFRKMGIPPSFTNWIRAWLENRRGFIEINSVKSRWFGIEKGGPQGSSLTPTVFISYHADMPAFLSWSSSHLFADDLAAVVAGQIGLKFSIQCIDIEKRLKLFCDQLEYYCILTLQPINYTKTEALWSTRAPFSPQFDIILGGHTIKWTKEFKYLGYYITPRHLWHSIMNNSRVIPYNNKTDFQKLILDDVVMHNATQIIKYSTYNKVTILPPLFHQIWVKVTGKTGFPLSEINSCKVLHSGMTTELIGDKMHNVHWQYKLWNNTDLEELFMFNSTGNKPIIFSTSSDNNNSPAQYLKQFIIKHLRTFHNASEKDKNFYGTINISEKQKYTKLANIIYKKFQLKQSIQSLSSQNSINKRLLLMLTDLFRIFVLFIFGGIYADADTYCMKSFYPLLSIPPYLYVINKSTSINKIHDDAGEVFTNFAAYESENQRGKLIGYSILGSIPNSEILFRLDTYTNVAKDIDQ
ncbi:unnamed protein product, partial [Adineta steineri]